MTDVVTGLPTKLAERYVVEREIGEGATAQVYLALDTRHDRRVALKILRPELANALSAERFLREIRVAAGLQHPNILALYDSGETADSLYFVMPYVEGETLRARLTRGGALGVGEAVRILGEIADALTHAHAHGVVHRDVKPENILIAEGHAFIGDFGIAYAARFAPEARLTGEGRVVGTAPYMSPEQAAGEEDVDGRSDQYSLACVFHEMLTGHTLFPGRTPRTAMARRLTTPPPRLRKIRRDVPPRMDDAIAKALAPDPGGRFATPAAFADAVTTAATQAAVAGPVWRRATAAFVVAAVAWIGIATMVKRWQDRPVLDRNLYAVMPFVHAGDSIAGLVGDDCQLLLGTAMSSWRGIRLVDDLRAKGAYAEHAGSEVNLKNVVKAGRALGAGVVAWGDSRVVGDSVHIRAALYDVAAGGRTLREYRVRVERGLSDISRKFRELADSLLLHGSGTSVAADAMGTSSIDAWRAYAAGHRALGDWDLPRAREAFERAIEFDPEYPHAYLWLVQTSGLEGMLRRAEWRDAAVRAAALSDRLAPTDQELARALLSIAEGRFPEACGRYRAMLRRDSLDFRAWYGLGECQALDRLVLSDRRSPSGWRFRSSQAAAIAAYSRALALTPSAHRAFRGRASSRLNALLYGEMVHFKSGYRVAGGDTLRYGAFPSLDHDTLAFIPYPLADLYAGKPETQPPTQAAAVGRNRERLRALTERWALAFPRSPDAARAYAHALEVTGDLRSQTGARRGALEVVRQARSVTRDPAQRFELATDEVRLLLKTAQYAPAAQLAESLVVAPLPHDPGSTARAAGLAALVGKLGQAASLYEEAEGRGDRVTLPDGSPVRAPESARRAAARLALYAAAGAPADSLRALWARVITEIRSWSPTEQRRPATVALLRGPAELVFAAVGPTELHRDLPADPPWLLETQAMSVRDSGAARDRVDTLIAETRARPWDPFSASILFNVALLMLAAQDTNRAIAVLDVVVETIPTAHDGLLGDAVKVASIIRAIGLRAELAAAQRDAVRTVRWADAFLALWRDADAPLTGALTRVRRARLTPGRS